MLQPGDVVQYDYEALARRPCTVEPRCHNRPHASDILDARKRPAVYGQVVEVDAGHVDVIWETGRWSSHGRAPWLGRLEALRPV